ncbi:MAG: Flp pilus assembly complex ATPase component TadA [Myxococcales bacterium]|nr:Flp pilus assembly complex ATPase component TadA [Myxococcales bacterium]
MQAAFQIRVDEPQRPSKWVWVEPGMEYIVGRDGRKCSIVVTDPSVSRRHLRLKWKNERLWAEDLGSTSGSYLSDGMRFTNPVMIQSGTELYVGRVRLFTVKADPSALTTRRDDDEGKLVSVRPFAELSSGGRMEVVPMRSLANISFGLDSLTGVEVSEAEPLIINPDESPGLSPLAGGQDTLGQRTTLAPQDGERLVFGPPSRTSSSWSSNSPEDGTSLSVHHSFEVTHNISWVRMREIHQQLLRSLDLPQGLQIKGDQHAFRVKIQRTVMGIADSMNPPLPSQAVRDHLVKLVMDEALGLGPLEDLLADESVSEVMVVDCQHVYAERNGKIERQPTFFTSDEAIKGVINRVVLPLGRRIDETQPMVDARLKDGSRVNAIIPPLALRGPCITIRKSSKHRLQLHELLATGVLTEEMARFLELAVRSRKNIVVSGGMGSGKTTLLNILSAAIHTDERIITIEEIAEIQLQQEHVVSLEAYHPDLDGKGEVTTRDLVKNALRMRPDRIVLGECRGAEAVDILQSIATGHDGFMTTLRANSPDEAISRLETLVLMYGAASLNLGSVRRQIAEAFHLIVQMSRYEDGSRRVSHISEVVGLNERGQLEMCEVFHFEPEVRRQGVVAGQFVRSEYTSRCHDGFAAQGLEGEGELW